MCKILNTTIRKQSAETLKSMLPCERGVHLHKSASFEKTPDKIQKKTLQRNPKHDAGKYFKI